MRGVAFEKHGGPEVLEERNDLPDPAIGPDQVLVRVRACSVNHLDIWTRRGLPYQIEMPHILGNDIAGVVEEVGALVRHVKPGDAVMLAPGAGCGHCAFCLEGDDNLCLVYDQFGLRKQGGYAELVASPARNAFPKPSHLTFEEAASMPLVFLTAWHMLVGRVGLRPGETVLVLAAGSGVGIAAIQIAKMLGATVIATASTDAKLERAKELGADMVVNYERDDFAAETRRLTGKRGVDVVVEHTGEATWEKSIAALGRNGRLVTCGATSGFNGRTDLRMLFAKHLSILGSYMGRIAEFDEVLSHIAARKLRPVVDRVLPLAEARAAHEAMERREQFGKIVLVP
ncbi:MAG: zinc-binding dehydrogenase [Candidatus Eiseniibacteriota bacterium]